MKWLNKLLAWPVVLLIFGSIAAAQAVSTKANIIFDNFSGVYYLSRDADGHSLLTTQETILADFPGTTNYYGITRQIPQNFQGHSVKVKILSVTDVSDKNVPYKTTGDKQGNLVLTIGDPAIAVYGFQTYHINYQTKDVVDTRQSTDQFLLDINGRGWQQSFKEVSATLHIPKSFSSTLIGKPSCYVGYLNTTANDCSINTQPKTDETVITAKSASTVEAGHTLVLKTTFKPTTFTKAADSSDAKWFIAAAIGALGMILFSARRLIRRR